MKVIIEGREYSGESQPFLGDLRNMKRYFGMGYGTAVEILQTRGSTHKDITDMLDDEEFTTAVIAWSWCLRRRAGEQITPDEAGRIDFTQIDMIREEGDPLPEGESDPKAESEVTGAVSVPGEAVGG